MKNNSFRYNTSFLWTFSEGRKTGALDFINYVLLNKFKDRKHYSFGISTESQGNYLNEGLTQQKKNRETRGISLGFYLIKL